MESQASGGKLLTTCELADYLGIPVQTVYAWAARGTGPERVKVGRYTRYRMSSIDVWLNAQVKQSRRAS
jgi:excisionase family DNA binding protein